MSDAVIKVENISKQYSPDDGLALINFANWRIISMLSEQIKSIISLGEGYQAEFKISIPAKVRELTENALSHRDYYEKGAVTIIEVFDERIEIANPGGLLAAVGHEFGRRSLSRNPLV